MEQNREQRITMEEILYYAMFTILLTLKGIGLEEGTLVFRFFLVCACGLFGAKILIGTYCKRELAVIFAGILWGIFIFFHVGTFSILIYFLMMLGMKHISVPKVMKLATAVWSACMLFSITAAIFAGRSGVQLVHEKLGMGPVLRESLGYPHPNVLHITYILFMVLVLYHCNKKNFFKVSVGLLLGDLFIFMYSLSFTGFMTSLAVFFFVFYFLYRGSLSKAEHVMVKLIWFGSILFSIVLPSTIEAPGTLYNILNPLLNNRIFAMKYYFDEYQQTFFGQRVLTEGLSLDNSFLYAFAWYGIVFFAVIMALYWVTLREYLKKKRYKELAIILSFFVAGLTEQFLFNASIKNITFIFLGEVLFQLLKKEGKALDYLSKWNPVFAIRSRKLQQIGEGIRQWNWKCFGFFYVGTAVVIFAILCVLPIQRYQAVYANERRCHCNGETVEREALVLSEDTLFVGELTEEHKYYYFNRENSNMLMLMDWQYKVSLCVYISFVAAAAGSCICGKRKR